MVALLTAGGRTLSEIPSHIGPCEFGMLGKLRAQQHDDQRDGARCGLGGPDHALGDGQAKHPRAEPVAGALVLESDYSMDQPDLQGVFSPASYKQGFVGMLDDYPGMTCGVWRHRPESVGYVRARSADPFEDPVIQPTICPIRCTAASWSPV